ncbi:MAG: hypothetical protein ACOZHQ_11345 [Thermodesulfobacteriota bacterium]
MFRRMFASDPVKQMQTQLAAYAPDPALWREVGAYLAAGRRPASPAARAALRAYLDLREGLGAKAAFRAGGELSYAALAEHCRAFFAGYDEPAGLEPHQCRAWARFCLAADHLLAKASEAAAQKGNVSRKLSEQAQARLAQVAADFLAPAQEQAREAARRVRGERRQTATQAAPGALAAPAA